MLGLFRRSRRDISKILEDVQSKIPDAIGENLVSLIAFGPGLDLIDKNREIAGKTGFRSYKISILIVLRENNVDRLSQLSKPMESISGIQELDLMVMTLSELHASTDVFPITFLEMKLKYRLLAGIDALENLEIGQSHLRLRCEQEMKNLLLRLQRNYLIHRRSLKLLVDCLAQSKARFCRTLSAALLLTDAEIPDELDARVRSAAHQFELDSDSTEALLAFQPSTLGGHDVIVSAYANLLSLVQAAACAIDDYPEEILMVEIVDTGSNS